MILKTNSREGGAMFTYQMLPFYRRPNFQLLAMIVASVVICIGSVLMWIFLGIEQMMQIVSAITAILSLVMLVISLIKQWPPKEQSRTWDAIYWVALVMLLCSGTLFLLPEIF